ncbi:DUF4327 family protein [Ancylothrix sp. C2]|jgi:hypothetical protein|uniref:DUF4327 family protein n=1 Tax=Ancylothrix sp. D3o TaxID=2953691 RepID=UPI0021BA5195|nr:DUF4327 family protein [Ancylothrix sp. D3o]MCT7948804.1 DUF4327 family protein [Ancylothrix sp. D3o]
MLPSVKYSLEVIQEEVRRLVRSGAVSRQQRIYALCEYIPPRDWVYFERELEESNYLLRDALGDLMGREEWEND